MAVGVGGDRLISRKLVGRSEELGRLSRAAEDARTGKGRFVLLAGDAGIGKTRLLAELIAGWEGRVFRGQCYRDDTAFPLAPVEIGLRVLLDSADDTDVVLFDRHAHVLARLLPELEQPAHSPAGTVPAARGGDGDPRASQRELFQAAADLLLDLADRQPLLVVFEDLHWSDETTLAFIRFLARRIEHHAVLLAGTYRQDQLPAALSELLATLDRERLTQQITLGRLARGEVDALLRGLFDDAHPISPAFLDAITAFSEGNPFHVEELVRAMMQAGDIYQIDGAWTL